MRKKKENIYKIFKQWGKANAWKYEPLKMNENQLLKQQLDDIKLRLCMLEDEDNKKSIWTVIEGLITKTSNLEEETKKIEKYLRKKVDHYWREK